MNLQKMEIAIGRQAARNPALAAEIKKRGMTAKSIANIAVHNAPESTSSESQHRLSAVPHGVGPGDVSFFESIILSVDRPTLLIQNGEFELPAAEDLAEHLTLARDKICYRLPSVGRVEVDDGSRRYPAGTAWMVAPDIAITNRHVAEHFATHDDNRKPILQRNFRRRPYKVNIDFLEEHDLPSEHEVRVVEVLYLPERRNDIPDIALIRLESTAALPEPIPLMSDRIGIDRWIGVIGYPLSDPRIPPEGREVEESYFHNIYGVKRLSPGKIDDVPDGITMPWILAHDATTLGGNSGSVLLDLKSGAAAGVHFRGHYKVANYAVAASEITTVLKSIGGIPTLFVPSPHIAGGDEGELEPTLPGQDEAPADLTDASGYHSDFIAPNGDQSFEIRLPRITANAPGELAPLQDGSHELKYRNFSVFMNRHRRLCYYSAVNIDGANTFSIKGNRPGWKIDRRLKDAEEVQVIKECYGPSQDGKFSRGHMTRREDPNWGDTREQAKISNRHTFYVTNACPQFQSFNGGIWFSLEDYALEHTDQDDMRITAFTGPVFQDADPDYFGVQIPVEYWKILAFKHDDTKKLVATGYLMSQRSVLPTQDEFIFGQFKNKQVTIRRIEQLTGLSFHQLAEHDPFDDGSESILERWIFDPSHIVFN
ncbi:MAG: DNA/RNA non-specific endonuclease [Pseudomonadota bacterium]